MATDTTIIDVSDQPALRRLVEEIQTTRAPRGIAIDGHVVATLTPIAATENGQQPKPRRSRKSGRNEWLRGIIGMADGPDDGVHDVALNHDKYLADAYADTHE